MADFNKHALMDMKQYHAKLEYLSEDDFITELQSYLSKDFIHPGDSDNPACSIDDVCISWYKIMSTALDVGVGLQSVYANYQMKRVVETFNNMLKMLYSIPNIEPIRYQYLCYTMLGFIENIVRAIRDDAGDSEPAFSILMSKNLFYFALKVNGVKKASKLIIRQDVIDYYARDMNCTFWDIQRAKFDDKKLKRKKFEIEWHQNVERKYLEDEEAKKAKKKARKSKQSIEN
jgi:hypothetical protein